MTKKIKFFILLSLITFTSIAPAYAKGFDLHLLTYEVKNSYEFLWSVQDANPLLNVGSSLHITEFTNKLRSDSRILNARYNQTSTERDNETIFFQNTRSFTFPNKTNVWLGEILNGKIQAADDVYCVNFNYQYHYSLKDVRKTIDILKDGNEIKTVGISQNVLFNKNQVRVVSSHLSKDKIRYIAVYISDLKN